MRIESYTETTWLVTGADGTSVLIEIYDEERRGVYGPLRKGVHSGVVGAKHSLAFTVDNDGITPFPGRLGANGYEDLIGETGRQIAVGAWEAWCDDPGRAWRERDSARAALVQALERAQQSEIVAAERLTQEQLAYQAVVDARLDVEQRLGQI